MFNLVTNFKPSIEIFLHIVLVFSIPEIKRGKRDQNRNLKIAEANMDLVDGVLVRTAAKESGKIHYILSRAKVKTFAFDCAKLNRKIYPAN